jgi:hypothetical protein
MDTKMLKASLPVILVAAIVAAIVGWAASSPGRFQAQDSEMEESAEADSSDSRGLFSFARREPVTVAAGTSLAFALDETVSTETHQAGDTFTGRVTSPVVVEGQTVIPAGARVEGRLAAAERKRIGGRGKLTLEVTSVKTSEGDRSVDATYTAVGKSQTKRDALTIGGATAGGAILGRTIGHEKGEEADGTAIGAVVGGGIGTAVAAGNRAPHVVLPAGTTIEVRLQSSLSV